jgi:hypothetical protein
VPGFNPNPAAVAPRVTPPSASAAAAASKLGARTKKKDPEKKKIYPSAAYARWVRKGTREAE